MPSLTISANVNNISPINNQTVMFNDMYLDQFGNIAMSTDLQSVLEQCQQAAQTLLGECIFDVNTGLPYEQTLWVGAPNLQQFTASLRAAFLNVPDVTEISNLDYQQTQSSNANGTVSQSADMLTYTATIQTNYGTGTIV